MNSKTLLLALGLQMCFTVAHAENDYSEHYAYADASQQSTFMQTDFSKTVNSALDVNFVNQWHLTLEIDRRAERFMRLSGAGFPMPKGADSQVWDQKYRQAQEQANANVLSEIASRGQAAAAERAQMV